MLETHRDYLNWLYRYDLNVRHALALITFEALRRGDVQSNLNFLQEDGSFKFPEDTPPLQRDALITQACGLLSDNPEAYEPFTVAAVLSYGKSIAEEFIPNNLADFEAECVLSMQVSTGLYYY